MITEIQSFVCEECGEIFHRNEPGFHVLDFPYCFKCNKYHIFCDACEFVHSLSASQQDHYLQSEVG